MSAVTNEPNVSDGGPVLGFDRTGAIVRLTLNRPEAMNALSPELVCRLADAFVEIAADDGVRVVILTGAGDKAFCSGGDLALTLPLLSGARAAETDWDRRLLADPDVLARSALRNFAFDKPIVAAINGFCLAGGFETMLATDIRIAADHAIFGLPEVRHALIPFAGSLARLPRQIGYTAAMELLLTGGTISAGEAHRIGLVNHVLPAAEVMGMAEAIAERIARNGPIAVRQVKATVLAASGRPLAEGFALEDAAKAIVMGTEDAREGPRAFMEKRAPRFEGR